MPLTLYIHYPWCESKCPYCDFNSHILGKNDNYIDVLIDDLKNSLKYIRNRKITAIFIGGGSPSLMSLLAIDKLFNALNKYLSFVKNIEITIEVNPSSSEALKFKHYQQTGINRISLGIQSFNDKNLQFLGRKHNAKQAKNASLQAMNIFTNVNFDLIFGLKGQTIQEVQQDLQTAINLRPQHLSFYQLTLEPNTYFAKYPPILPNNEILYKMMQQGIEILTNNNYPRYEVSAFGKICKHNLNYWQFGDYIGIGAGAHSKITTKNTIFRIIKKKSPNDYISNNKEEIQVIQNISFEFMLNALRLKNGFAKSLFQQTTRQKLSVVNQALTKAQNLGLITINSKITPTDFGFNHLNSLQELFL